MVGSVLLALITANAAGFGARLERRPSQPGLEGRLAGDDPARGVADVGAVEVEPDAAGERLGVILPKAGVGAGGAALGTVAAGLNALHQRGGINRGGARVGLVAILPTSSTHV